jgi:hypothetical protein
MNEKQKLLEIGILEQIKSCDNVLKFTGIHTEKYSSLLNAKSQALLALAMIYSGGQNDQSKSVK